jgi:hypothetical protein
MLVGGGCSGESYSGGIRNSAEKGIFQRANCQVFALEVFEIRRALQETGFFAPEVFYSRRAPCETLELTLNKSAKVPLHLLSVFYFPQSKIEYHRSKNCSARNPPPIVNPGLKWTRTDAILKKFD